MCLSMYAYVYRCAYIRETSVRLYRGEIKNSNNIRDCREELWVFVNIRYSHYLWSSTLLFESGLGLVANVIANSRATTKKNYKEEI